MSKENRPHYIKSLALCNFKGFSGEPVVFKLKPNINYVIGDNNCGKSTFLQALQFVLTGNVEDVVIEDLVSHRDDAEPASFSTYVECVVSNFPEDKEQADKAAPATLDMLMPHIFREEASEEPAVRVRRYVHYVPGDSFDISREADEELSSLNEKFAATGGPHTKLLIWDDGSSQFVFPGKAKKNLSDLFQMVCFGAMTQPSDIVNGNASSTATRLTQTVLESRNFNEGEAWKKYCDACQAVKNDPDSGLQCNLKEIGEQVSEIIQRRFPGVDITFTSNYEPTIGDLLKKLEVIVSENGSIGSLESKGGGLQRDIAFALSRMQIEGDINNPPSYPRSLYVFDEPENCLHPKAQMNFSGECHESDQQYFVATHSPYLLMGYDHENDNCVLLSRHKEDARKIAVESAEQLGKAIAGKPSLGEITYFAFSIPTMEFHNELYGALHRRLKDKAGKTLFIDDVDKRLRNDYDCPLCEKKRFDDREHDRGKPFDDCLKSEALPTAIRNCIDHPESYAKGCAISPERKDELFEITDELLAESIQILLGVLQQV